VKNLNARKRDFTIPMVNKDLENAKLKNVEPKRPKSPKHINIVEEEY